MKRFWENMDGRALLKKYKYPLLLLLVGVFLMLLPSPGQDEGKEEVGRSAETFSLEETEKRMEDILGRIQGVGKLKLMLTLKSGAQLELAEDADRTLADDETRIQTETIILDRGSGYEDVVITRQIYPVYQGALIVCQGADQAAVRLAVTEAIAALTGLSSEKITVVKWNS